jgi:hypothetical protein
MMPNVFVDYQPGDCLIYRPTGFFGWAIAVKTWHRWSHVEAVEVPGKTAVASRDGKGVNRYPFRQSELGMVVRPGPAFTFAKAMAYFETVQGQPYDFWGLMSFYRTKAAKTNGRQFCSEFLTNFYRAGGCNPFHGEPAEVIPPYYFATLADEVQIIWSDETP